MEINLAGYIDFMGKRSEFRNGTVNGNQLALSGTIPSALTNIQYNITGNVQGNILNINAKTNMGSFNLQGTKISNG